MLTNQMQIHIKFFIHKLIHIFNAKGGTQYQPVRGENLPGAQTNLASTCPGGGSGGKGWIILGLGKQIRHLIIFCFNIL